MTRYRFLDAMGDVVLERQFADHEAALAWASAGPSGDPDDPDDDQDDDGPDDDGPDDYGPDLDEAQIQRVEYLGPGGDWRWAGALQG